MAYETQEVAKLVKKFQLHPNDTASPQVQIALLTYRLKYLNEHFSKNKKDHHSRNGLLKLVGKRRALLKYLKANDLDAHAKLIAELGIRK